MRSGRGWRLADGQWTNRISAAVGSVKMLQGVDSGVMLLHGRYSIGGGLRGGNGGDGGNALEHRCPANGLLIENCVLAARGIHDHLDAVALDEIHDVGAAFFDFEIPALR